MSTPDVPETEQQQPVRGRGSNGRAIPATCTTHEGATGFTNLMVSKHDGGIKLDPHVAGLCVITLDEAAATALFDLLGELTTVNPSPQPYCDRLAATVEQLGTTRSILRQVIALADDSATLSNEQLRDRLAALAESCGR